MFCGWIIPSRVICSFLVMNISESVSYLLLAKAMNFICCYFSLAVTFVNFASEL